MYDRRLITVDVLVDDFAPAVWGQDLACVSGGAISPNEVLWLAVINQSFQDALWEDPHPGTKVTSKNGGSLRRDLITAKSRARVWLRGRTRDFHEVCSNAGVDPEVVTTSFVKLNGGIAP